MPHSTPVIVYGANGFIGRNLCLALSAASIDTIAVSRAFDSAFQQQLGPTVRCVKADFADTESLFADVVPAGGATHVLLVSDSVPSTWSETPSREVSGNLLSHVRFFERLGENDRAIYVSSGGTVYGIPARHAPLKETDAVAVPISAYGVTKLAIEKYLAFTARQKGYDYLTLRPSNPVGPWSHPGAAQGAVSVLIERHLRDEPFQIWGTGEVTRDYLDVRDLSRAMLEIVAMPSLGGQVFNVGSGIGRTLNEVVHAVETTLGIKIDVRRDTERNVDVPYNVLDSTRLKSATGWVPTTEFSDTIRDTFAYLSLRYQHG